VLVIKETIEAATCRVLPFFCTLPHSDWILWNLVLAFIPLVLTIWIFRKHHHWKRPLWWILFVTYAAFLPNAPYLLTDIIHTIDVVRSDFSIWSIVLVFIPVHVVAIISGFQSYVLCVILQSRYLILKGQSRWVNLSELLTHMLCAVGIFLGRFLRLNSWDLVTSPRDVIRSVLNTLTTRQPILVILVTFLIITVLYWITKQITLGLVLRFRQIAAENAASRAMLSKQKR
jgi:uncharacterized membrane protein